MFVQHLEYVLLVYVHLEYLLCTTRLCSRTYQSRKSRGRGGVFKCRNDCKQFNFIKFTVSANNADTVEILIFNSHLTGKCNLSAPEKLFNPHRKGFINIRSTISSIETTLHRWTTINLEIRKRRTEESNIRIANSIRRRNEVVPLIDDSFQSVYARKGGEQV